MPLMTDLLVSAELRRIQSLGLFGCVLAKGDKERGAIMIKHWVGADCHLFERTIDFDDKAAWRRLTPDTGLNPLAVDEKINKHRNMDDDLWVLEVEDNKGIYSLPDPILD